MTNTTPTPTPTGTPIHSTRTIVAGLIPLARPYWKRYSVSVALLVVTTLLSLLPPMLIKMMIDRGLKEHDARMLDLLALATVGVVVVMGITRGLMDYVHEWVGTWFMCDLRARLFAHIQRQSLGFFTTTRVGEMLSRLRTDVMAVYGVFVNTFLGALGELTHVVGIAAFMFWLEPRLTLLALLVIPPLALLLGTSSRRLRTMSLIVRDQDVRILDFFQDVLTNIQAVKLFHREEFGDRLHRVLSETAIALGLRRVRYKFVFIFLIGTLTTSASVILLWYGGRQVIAGTLSFGSLFAFYLYTLRLYGPIQSLANRGVEISNGLASAQRVLESFDIRTGLPESPSAVSLPSVAGRIHFDDVSFRYPGGREPVLRGVTAVIAAGEKVAVVGRSGAGKTTLMHLLCRLYDVDGGAIRIDGHDLRDLRASALADAIGVVSQDVFLFNDTIEENIRFGRPSASRDEIVQAARNAQLHEFISNLPDGYGTVVGARGLRLSGGQRQRIALARVLLKDARIWILDEFSAALDSETETLLYSSLAPYLHGRTALIIAHRLSTVLAAERILVLHEGAIAAGGAHADLLAECGVYRQLFEAQFAQAPGPAPSGERAAGEIALPALVGDPEAAPLVVR